MRASPSSTPARASSATSSRNEGRLVLVRWSDYLAWQIEDADIASKINTLIEDARRSPFRGLGKPEPLRQQLTGWWSRRITSEHRLFYRVAGSGEEQRIEILARRFRY